MLTELESSSSFRMVHVDGSHTYEIVVEDLKQARRLLTEGGVLIVDDWRQAHTPGVAAATWEAILETQLVPICYTDQKLYATWSNRISLAPEEIEAWGGDSQRLKVDHFQVRGRPLCRVSPRTSDAMRPNGSFLRRLRTAVRRP